ncbi:hypothetical protein H5T88_07660 [bacterium]|nr:hypothetical protein [bacterium]
MFRKEGGAFAPASPSPERPEEAMGVKQQLKGGVEKDVENKERVYID